MNTQTLNTIPNIERPNLHLSAQVIVVDATYLDQVAGALRRHFSQEVGKELPPADLCRWLDCIALDAGIVPATGNQIQVLFIHDELNSAFQHLSPACFSDELNGKAFRDRVGEFLLVSCAADSQLVAPDFFFFDTLSVVADSADVRHLMIVSSERRLDELVHVLKDVEGKQITLFDMHPQGIGGYRHEVLGYSLMAALGVGSTDLQK